MTTEYAMPMVECKFKAAPAVAKPSRDQIEHLEQIILSGPQVDLQTTHALSGGVYARTIIIPAGTVLTGAVHKKDHINVVQGDITVSTDDGMVRLTGHHIIPTKAGAKRVGYAHQDTVWTTICHTNLEDIEAIEDELVEDSDRLQTRQNKIAASETQKLEG